MLLILVLLVAWPTSPTLGDTSFENYEFCPYRLTKWLFEQCCYVYSPTPDSPFLTNLWSVFLCSFKCVFSWQPLAGAFWACVPTAVWWVPDYKQFPWWHNPYMGLPECLHQWPVRGAIALTDIHVCLQIAGTRADQSFQQITSSLLHYVLWFFWGVLVDKIHWSYKIIVSKITLFSIVLYQFVYIVGVIIVAIYFVVLKFYFKRMKDVNVFFL